MSNEELSMPRGDARLLFVARLALGLLQGVGLYLLYRSVDAQAWPSTNPYHFAPLLAVGIFVPLLASQALGTMRLRTLIPWIALAVLATAYLAWHDRDRDGVAGLVGAGDFDAAVLPSFAVMFFTAAALFIAQSLVAAGDGDKRLVARYSSYFDAAWKFGVQAALAGVFVGVFWLVLWLGAELFDLINLNFLEKLIQNDWFWIPATTLATAAAIHLTDVRARLVAGIRAVVLTLLGWLLPLMALIAIGFLATLIFVGLDPLWKTRDAASGMLSAAAFLVILINAAYQNGENESARPALLRYSEALASIALIPLVIISAVAIKLRIDQYGWTEERVATVACVLVAACYATGYTLAAILSLRSGGWMKWLERCNIFAAFAVVAVLIALFTPIADPTRLSVDSQVSRLLSGETKPAKFDFAWLKYQSGRYGREALLRLAALKTGRDAADIATMAKGVLASSAYSVPPRQLTLHELAANITVYPRGRALPEGFLRQDWSKTYDQDVPECLWSDTSTCDAVLTDINGDGADDILIVYGTDDYWTSVAFVQAASGKWMPVGTFRSPRCGDTLAMLHSGRFATAPSPWRDLVFGDQRAAIDLPAPRDPPPCPKS